MTNAAVADVFGGGTGWLMLTTPDPATAVVLELKARAAAKLAERRDKNLAVQTANFLGKVLGGKKGRK